MLELVNRRRGLFVKLPSTEVIDVIAASGLDFAVIDLEHSQLGESEARALVRHARAMSFPALVRIPEPDRGAVNRLLEAGAAGIQLSTVRTVAEMRALRDATRYAPQGARSISLSHPEAGYGAVSLEDYLRSAEAHPALLVAQIETAETLDPLDEILAAGPDVAFLGLTDLSVDLGLDSSRVRARVDEVAAAAERAGVALGAFGLDDPRVVYQLVSSDLALLREAVAGAA
ncbi:MAG TPA: aldolase/citrate lyase family protein [Candidatus Limnocylindria bacterium]|jgi:4-hydroxy-2-oxoheptanedioate aldolase|nr:aldolase/citrate lyase family protein [Candidatus Limnocylindria bacterium]